MKTETAEFRVLRNTSDYRFNEELKTLLSDGWELIDRIEYHQGQSGGAFGSDIYPVWLCRLRRVKKRGKNK